MKQIINEIYERGSVLGWSGQVHKLHSAISPEEGEFLFSIIQDDPTIKRTLEVGCAYGLSSLHICAAIRDRKGASHTIIDPFQKSQWDAAGIKNLEKAGVDFFNLIENKSEIALPQLLEKNEAQFDFIFIDGWHTFDHTLLDCFYATRLLRVDGVLAIDDVSWKSVRRSVNFLKNYPCYEEIGFVGHRRPKTWKKGIAKALAWPVQQRAWAKILNPSVYQKLFQDHIIEMIALKKTREDTRNWDWHVDWF
jgi:predicted O-methyltransferase YrrM